ncbi:hypothetical protein [Pantoea sp. 1.19]|uniref:hypothetical protein n=1 Tax=Pantoea sp. 1.19 TaxID=1925589 RepID=UPI0009488D0D|nr:hypothetical protein [Pantoea sp. 1.19]
MGFPSPARDYVERPFRIDELPGIDTSVRVHDFPGGFAIIKPVSQAKIGDTLLVSNCGSIEFVRLSVKGLVMPDGECIAGEQMEGVEVLGRVIYQVLDFTDGAGPV